MDIFYIYVNKYSLERITMKKKITIIGALILFSVAAFAQIIYTYHCLHCGSVKANVFVLCNPKHCLVKKTLADSVIGVAHYFEM